MSDTQAVATNDAHVDFHASAEGASHDAAVRQLTHPGYILIGCLLALLWGLGHWYLPEAYLIQSLGILGGLLGGAYAGMGVMAGEKKKELLQIGMGLVITVFTCAGVWVSPVFFALLCFVHGIWDLVSGHPRCLNLPLSPWYVPMCLGYDFLFGAMILAWWAW